MRKYIRSLTIFVLISFITASLMPHYNYAKSQTPTSTSSAEVDESVKILREKIATKVAELQEKNEKVLAGYIEKLDEDNDTVTVDTGEEEKTIASYDSTITEIFDVSGNEKTKIEFGDLEKTDYIVIAGHELEDSLNATIIYRNLQYAVGVGKIIDLNKADFSAEVLTTDKDTITLDFERSTQQRTVDINSLRLLKSGFSKINTGDTIHFVLKLSAGKKKTRFSAVRTLIIPQEYFEKDEEKSDEKSIDKKDEEKKEDK